MEEKKLDLNSIIGFILIFGILIWIMYQNKPSEEAIAAEKAKKEMLAKESAKKADAKQVVSTPAVVVAGDSTQLAQAQKTLGGFAYSATLPSAKDTITTIENTTFNVTGMNAN